MGTITTTTISPGAQINAEPLDNNFNNIKNEFNGNIEDVNIKASAGISWSKISKSGSAIDDIADVTITSVVDGEALRYNGSAWVNSKGKFYINTSKGDITSDTDGATITFDMNVSNLHTVTLGGNRTLAVSNVAVGQKFILRLVQDGTGSRTVTWFATIKWPGGSAPTLTTTLNKTDVFGFLCTSADNYDAFILGQNL